MIPLKKECTTIEEVIDPVKYTEGICYTQKEDNGQVCPGRSGHHVQQSKIKLIRLIAQNFPVTCLNKVYMKPEKLFLPGPE